jgi:hypothetical protein
VDLSYAMHVVGSEVCIAGRSDGDLVHRVQQAPNFVPGCKPVIPAAGLDGGIVLRPVEAVHALSYATRPRYQDDLLDMYLLWALIRYIGLFDLAYAPEGLTLRLSDAGQRITGNQRRITSEEMGIGFGALLAHHWFTRTVGYGVPIGVVDVDAALDDRYLFAGGSRYAVRAVGQRRPDYLLVAPDPASRRRYRIRALECKGTRGPANYAVYQLASAVEQLAGISVAGRIPSGVAVSTITANDRVSYLAVDPGEDDEPSYEVDSATLDQSQHFQLTEEARDVSPTLLTSASVRASWATLADFSGNLAALDLWAPSVMRRRLDRRPRQRVTFDTPYGDARGTTVSMNVNGQTLAVRYAAARTVDDQMTQRGEAIADAQADFAAHLRDAGSLTQQSGADLYSATPDGSIFVLTLE